MGKSEFLRTAAERGDVLSAIGNGVVDRNELESVLDKSRKTINRDIRLLRESRLLVDTNGEVQLTTVGEVVAELYEFSTAVETNKSVLNDLDVCPPAIPTDAAVSSFSTTTPQDAIDAATHKYQSGRRLASIMPTYSHQLVTEIAQQFDEAIIKIPESVGLQQDPDKQSPQRVEIESICWDGPLRTGVDIVDGTVVYITAYTENYLPTGEITTSNREIVRWAETAIDRGEWGVRRQ
jgi:hypothetical protein